MKVLKDFRDFAFKGSMIDLAIAVVIGTAFAAVIASLVKNVLMPGISYIMPAGGAWRTWMVGRVEIGAFIGELINFLLVAAAVFVAVVQVRKYMTKPQPTVTKECPHCASMIPTKAHRCPQCTSDLDTPSKMAA